VRSALLLLALGLAVFGLVPPAVVPATGDPTGFSAARAFAHVEAIAARPRPIGSDGNAAARDYLVERVRGLGLEPVLQAVTVPDYYAGPGEVAVVNVIARIGGTDPTGAIVLVAHYDTVPVTPGANDNAAAVAATLETGRAILAGPALRNDVILLFTDGEEPAPRYGSTAFVQQHAYAKDARLVINLEAIGGSGVSELIEVTGDEGALVARFAATVPRPAASSVLDDVVELIGGSNTDMAPFRDRGVAGFEFAYLRGSPIYHTQDDNLASVHHRSLQHHGSHTLALTRSFGEVDLADLERESQAVFFTLAGRFVVSYPTALGVVVALVAGLLLALAFLTEQRAGRLAVRRILPGAGRLLLLAVGVAIVVGLAWRLLTAALWTGDGPGAGAATAWLIAILAITIGSTLLLHRRLTARIGAAEAGWAAVALWWALALTTSLAMPGAGYLFVWPVLAATVVSTRRSPARWARLVAFSVVAATALLLAVPVLDTFFQMGQPRPGNADSQMPEVVAIVALLGSLLTVLLVPHWRAARRRAVT
jgi:hypothetical protein